jgi:hypothetical protein
MAIHCKTGVQVKHWLAPMGSTAHSTVQYSKYSTVQYSTVQYSTVQYSTVQYSWARAAHDHDYDCVYRLCFPSCSEDCTRETTITQLIAVLDTRQNETLKDITLTQTM